ncbi:hypothetical protein HZB04_03030 [Candidatus Wolfebacteria bacterium]|nr:hypothetical protein [Candidatus Wolfebacteria bacterium]
MDIVITDLEGDISASIFSYEGCESAEEVQLEITEAGGTEKVIDFLEFSEGDDLKGLLLALCAFGNGKGESFQYAMEGLLTKIYILGQENGKEFAKKKSTEI